MVRRSTEISLKDAIGKFLKDFKLEEKLDETRLLGSWEKVAGKLIARHTQELYIKDKVLFIRTDSAALKQELTYMKSKLLEKLNKTAGKQVVEEIKFL